MNLFGITKLSYERILQVLSSYKEVEKAIIFGSRAKGNYQPGSDIDIALFGDKCTPLIAMNIAGRLNESEPIPYYIDVVNYNSLTNQKLKEHIDRAGQVLYDSQVDYATLKRASAK